MAYPTVFLEAQRHKRVSLGHPWVYSNEVVMDTATKNLDPGTLVEFRAHDKRLLGQGTFNPHCLIAGRIFSRDAIHHIDTTWVRRKILDALALRQTLFSEPFYRLIHAEADGLPGLIIDRFDRTFAVQVNTAGIERLWPLIQDILVEVFKPQAIVLRNESANRIHEGLPSEVRLAFGSADDVIEVRENNLVYFADIVGGQKTGWYFDQRDNHALVAKLAKTAKSVLDLYTHAGGFGLLAAKAGALQVVGVDSSATALALAEKAALRNKISNCRFARSDVFEDLERRIAAKEKHDVVIADPPAFVKSRKDIASGGRGYRKLAKLCASVTDAGGLFYIASCSHNMELPAFIEHVAIGIHDAGRSGRILYTTFASPDHPVHPHLPESSYLKGILLRFDD